MTEIPLPDDIQPPKSSEEDEDRDKGFCDKCCECWCQVLVALILISILLAVFTDVFWFIF